MFYVNCLSLLIFSAIAVNLKACNHFRLYNGKAAEVRLWIFPYITNTKMLPELGFRHSTYTIIEVQCLILSEIILATLNF